MPWLFRVGPQSSSGSGRTLLAMADVLALLAFGGNIHAGSGLSAPVVEIWECTAHWNTPDITIAQSYCDAIAADCVTWFEDAATKIADNVDLSYVKWNEINPATGRQVTDPTIQTLEVGVRGSSSSSLPLTSSYRVSLDDSTRNPRHRGGFYVPRPALSVQDDGRLNPGDPANLLSTAKAFFDAIIAVTGGQPGVYSRRDHAFHPANRMRVGDVPDNIRRRKNKLRENYAVTSI